jgi:Ankyrin repeat
MRETPLHVASAKNDVDVLKFLLDWRGPEMIELEARNTVNHHNVQACDSLLHIVF